MSVVPGLIHPSLSPPLLLPLKNNASHSRTGVMPGDVELAKWLRRLPPPHRVLLVANKCERPAASAAGLAECTQLGFGPGIAISAETGDGMADLYAGLQPLVDAAVEEREGEETEIGDDGGGRSIEAEGVSTPAPPELLRLAIVGLPNVGKSTLCNTLLQSERCLTGPEPGLTRDAVRAKFEHQARWVPCSAVGGWGARGGRGDVLPIASGTGLGPGREIRAWLRVRSLHRQPRSRTPSRTLPAPTTNPLPLLRQGQRFELVDTAGWVRKTRLAAHDPDAGGVLTQRALAEGAAAMQGAHVVIQLVDGHRSASRSGGRVGGGGMGTGADPDRRRVGLAAGGDGGMPRARPVSPLRATLGNPAPHTPAGTARPPPPPPLSDPHTRATIPGRWSWGRG